MLRLPEHLRIFVATHPADMRKHADGLCGLITTVLGEEPRSGHLFVFFNRPRDIVRIVFWDTNGFCVVSKRLERGRFAPPSANGIQSKLRIDPQALAALLAATLAPRNGSGSRTH